MKSLNVRESLPVFAYFCLSFCLVSIWMVHILVLNLQEFRVCALQLIGDWCDFAH